MVEVTIVGSDSLGSVDRQTELNFGRSWIRRTPSVALGRSVLLTNTADVEWSEVSEGKCESFFVTLPVFKEVIDWEKLENLEFRPVRSTECGHF